MLVKSEYDIQFHLSMPTPMMAMLHLHPSLEPQVKAGNELAVEHIYLEKKTTIPVSEYRDVFGNRCSRFMAPAGAIRLSGTSVVEMEGLADPINAYAKQVPVEELPSEVLQYLLASRYCEVDKFGPISQDLFGWMTPGWTKASAIRDWVHEKVMFNYRTARSTKTAMDVFTERVGVCRDYQHLAITLSRCQNIPARYVTGYLGDIRSPYSGLGDFSAWYEVFLDGRWMTMDARHNEPRIGRVLMAAGRDAADVAITTSFGNTILTNFYVDSYEVREDGTTVPSLPGTIAQEPIVTSANRGSAGAVQGLAE
ncbi:transglutaminase-like domain-containing protein [Tunturiibacter gelidoferens]|jgi:transglutaminase-like putative cysteine protease|uniref:Transglutaminase-like putative cysteine protease n=1 Tax=Tunturiibacter gelidiferens TaxID=3069689 RepID=A0A9X0QER7_9BACT|nr:transglutaminase family protein [Edaphobacter lichenicola]MBB5329052.1 transglutaminase-like putative cysteine protease [Edaphobacter lichenicola]